MEHDESAQFVSVRDKVAGQNGIAVVVGESRWEWGRRVCLFRTAVRAYVCVCVCGCSASAARVHFRAISSGDYGRERPRGEPTSAAR